MAILGAKARDWHVRTADQQCQLCFSLVARRLRVARHSARIPMLRLAKALGTKASVVRAAEAGEACLTPDALRIVARETGRSVRWLLGLGS